jgi:hypothetical protein
VDKALGSAATQLIEDGVDDGPQTMEACATDGPRIATPGKSSHYTKIQDLIHISKLLAEPQD